MVALFALGRLGYVVLTLSLRIPPVAIISFLKQTDCNIIAGGDGKTISDAIAAVNEERPVQKVVLPTRAQYGARTPDELGERLIQENINFGVVFGW